MSKKSWLKLDYSLDYSSMDRPVSELFERSHTCDKHSDVYLSNALLGQYTGLKYTRFNDVTEIKFECLRCRARFVRQVHGFGRDDIPPFPEWAFAKARDAMFERGCKHMANWMMSPVLRDEDDHQIRVIHCSTCKMRVRFDW